MARKSTAKSANSTSDAQKMHERQQRTLRERRRWQDLNAGFDKLIELVSFMAPKQKFKLTKIQTLRLAIKYIQELGEILEEDKKD